MSTLPAVVRSRAASSRLRDHVRRPVIYGAVVQAVTLLAFVGFASGMRPAVFVVGMTGPAVAAVLTVPDAGWVDAPLAGVLGGCVYLLSFLAYAAAVSARFEFVAATWVFAGYVATAITQAIMLLPAFVFFGLFVGGGIGYAKASWRRYGRR
ncbi:hypothetical protein [Haloparvum sedimenti]|uniref:hypothetical protein n=1 Tax=Haloparvum sedimenti TaxID=1678448 RepID=UPI00071E981E|nr:hypothetical protein [Haloparvum sedimenti]